MNQHLHIPERRYAIYRDVMRGDYAIVVSGPDMLTAPSWGGFVGWLGGVKPSEIRFVKEATNGQE